MYYCLLIINPHNQALSITLVIFSCGMWDLASLIAQLGKNLPAMQETLVQFLGQEDPLEKGQTTTVFWPGEFHGLLHSPWDLKESDMTERLSLSLTCGIQFPDLGSNPGLLHQEQPLSNLLQQKHPVLNHAWPLVMPPSVFNSSSFDFHDLDTLKDYRSVVLQNVLQFGLVSHFLKIEFNFCILGKGTADVNHALLLP